MGKSIRSKAKRTHRRTKRESGVFAAQDAARLQRLSVKLAARKDLPVEREDEDENADGADPEAAAGAEGVAADSSAQAESMQVDGAPGAERKISTHGPRNSGRELWRKSKGLAPRRKTEKTNRQGVLQATKRAGRSKRRR